MDILVTGRVASISESLYGTLTERHKVVVSSDDIQNSIIGKKVIPFRYTPHEKGFEKLFHSYSFEAVLVFSQRPEEENDYYNELQDLESILRLCASYDVKNVIYISSTSVYAGQGGYTEATSLSPVTGVGVVLEACEKLCEFYRTSKGLPILILHTPSLFGHGERASLSGKMIYEAVRQASVTIAGMEKQTCDFLAQEDLAELLIRILDDWPAHLPVMNLPGGSCICFSELAEGLKRLIPTLRISYKGRLLPLGEPSQSQTARKEYDWIPVHSILEDLPELTEKHRTVTERKNRTVKEKIKNFFTAHTFIIQIAELIIGYLLMEFLNTITQTSVQFRYVDFRLLFVMLMGTLHGLRTGLGAAALAGISCLAAYINNGMDWRIILYNIDNWLPFACYIIIGAVSGYIKDRMRNDLCHLEEEKQSLEERYIFLNELYAGALQNKGQFKNQIMSYRDSFGRIFEVTRRLNNVVPDAVFKEALGALEDILENETICIYTLDEHCRFGRLMVCSKQIANTTTKSIDLTKLRMMTDEFREGEVWSNTQRLLGYPEYAAPIFRGDQIVALITVQKVKYEQMAMYYENLIRVLCGLIQVSLLRAVEYNEHLEKDIYLSGTYIMKPEYFKETLRWKDSMEEEGISEYSLLHINTTPETMKELGNLISSRLRSTDILGQGDNGELYLVLSQTSEENIGFVLKRLQESGIDFQQMGEESGGVG